MGAPSIASGSDMQKPGWGSVADAWARHADYVDERCEALTGELLERAAVAPGDRVLDLACGPGGLGIAAAPRVGPEGHVVLSDAAPEMIEVATARARERGVERVTGRVIDLGRIDEPDASYDVVLCREGFMFAPDHARAARDVLRILRPGGWVAMSVWADRARNPWLGLILDAVSAELGIPIPPPHVPGPFALGDPAALRTLLSDAGFEDVEVTEHDVPARVSGFDEWWGRTTSLTGPMAQLIASLPAERLEAIRSRARESLAVYGHGDGIDIPGVALAASARRS